uniref:Putative tick transposon n=1 Tax=Ixodes scapularis TaxID=6945 RepID=A0A4D5RYT2_IXOSC
MGTSGGCCLFLRKSLGFVETAVISCAYGRFVICDFSFSNMQWRVICVYAPNRECERRVFFEGLSEYLNCERFVIFLGDFNCVCAPQDRVNLTRVRDQSAFYVTDIVANNSLEDVTSVSSSNGVCFTHFQGSSHARLDRAYVSLDLAPQCAHYFVQPVSFSDHSLVMFTIGKKVKQPNWNWSLWKMNSCLVKDEVFTVQVKELFRKLHEEEVTMWAGRWERFKEQVKLEAIERSSILNFQRKQKEKALRSLLCNLLLEESANPGEFRQEIRQVKNQLEFIDCERYRGAIVRSRSEKLWQGERPTKRAMSDEKRYAQRKEITELCVGNSIIRDKKAIEGAFVEFYRFLLRKSVPEEDGFENEFLSLMPRLEEHVRERLEEAISVRELTVAIEELSASKTPGPNGLSAEFYRAFKREAAEALHEVLTEAYRKNMLPPSSSKSHIVLIPKSDDPVKLLSVSSYRPISLTNVDYKIYMKVLACRLQNVITYLVGPHQTCGIKGRSICTNIHVARSILECCDAFAGRVAMLQLDLEKAFDKVAHDILFRILEHVNVGSVLLYGIKMAYADCATSIIVNRSISKNIHV